MALPCPAIIRTNIIDSAISVGSYGWSDESQGRKNNDVLVKRLTNTIARTGKTSSATNNSLHQQKNSNNKKEKEYSAPQLKKRKKGKEITTESRSCNLPESSEEKIEGGSPLLQPWEERRKHLVMEDKRRRLVEMANRYLRKHCSEDDACNGSSPKRQRLGN